MPGMRSTRLSSLSISFTMGNFLEFVAGLGQQLVRFGSSFFALGTGSVCRKSIFDLRGRPRISLPPIEGFRNPANFRLARKVCQTPPRSILDLLRFDWLGYGCFNLFPQPSVSVLPSFAMVHRGSAGVPSGPASFADSSAGFGAHPSEGCARTDRRSR
jgi:hypothetical protein